MDRWRCTPALRWEHKAQTSRGFQETQSQGQGNSNPVHLTYRPNQDHKDWKKCRNLPTLCNWDKQYCLRSPWHIFLRTTAVSLMIWTYAHELMMLSFTFLLPLVSWTLTNTKIEVFKLLFLFLFFFWANLTVCQTNTDNDHERQRNLNTQGDKLN